MPLIKHKTMPYKDRTTITLRKDTKKELQDILLAKQVTYEEFFTEAIEILKQPEVLDE